MQIALIMIRPKGLFGDHIPYVQRHDGRENPDVSADLRVLPLLPKSSVESSCKVKSTWRWFGPRSTDCKTHFHVTVMERILVKPLFKVWGIWEKLKIKMQTSLPYFGTLKAAFLIVQSTPQFSANRHLGQLHSNWIECHWSSFLVHFREACLHWPQQAGLKNLLFTRRQTGLFLGEGHSGNTGSLEWPWMVQISSHRAKGT